MTVRDDRRAHHPEVDWQQPCTIMHEDDNVIHPRATGRNYANQEPLYCICGATIDAHDPMTGECAATGCEMLYIDRSESIR